jgi:hypothetical protein
MAGAVKDWPVAEFAAGGILGDTKPALAETAPRQSAAAVEHWINEDSFLIKSMVWLTGLQLVTNGPRNAARPKAGLFSGKPAG